ncbi:MAG: 50S ribosomal protein L11 methyltransferase [Steroidobacteraceae bacterium]
MPFLQLTLELGKSDPEPVADALFAIGALSVTLEDAADDPILEPAPGALPLWPTVNIKALFDAATGPQSVVTALQTQLQTPLPTHRFEQLADRPWEREWLKDFHPMQFGQRLWICPDGQRPDDPHAIVVDLDPGLAFGTGTHPTTALCLQWLDQHAPLPATLIDYGCGSGILAIAALKLGAQRAVGVDIDPQALLASRDNAERNGVSTALSLSLHDVELQPAELLIANILAGPLETLAPRLAALTQTNGHIVLSGVLTEQAAAVQNCYAAWFEMEPIMRQGDWARLSGKKRAARSSLT